MSPKFPTNAIFIQQPERAEYAEYKCMTWRLLPFLGVYNSQNASRFPVETREVRVPLFWRWCSGPV
jgi:hypothetical protein